MEWFSCVVSAIGRDLVCGAKDQLRYPCRFNNFVTDLQNEKDNLMATRDSVKDRVEHDKKQVRKTAEVVHKWLKDANMNIDNVEELLKKVRTNQTCCLGHCPNWIWRYHMAKKLAKKRKDTKTCIQKGSQYIQLERVASFSDMVDFPSERCLKFNSRHFAYKQLMEALRDDEVAMVGLYGMGGCGKTTLATELMKTVEVEHLFDKVLFVPVSSTVEVARIQDKIASALTFQFPEIEEKERAQRLCTRLSEENRILIILDDVWELLDFGVIGIPSRVNHTGCKVLITTRSEDICKGMGCNPTIPLSILTDEEAWTLFQRQAHIDEGTSITLKDLARQISDECKGLPVAIVAVASSLKGKADDAWKVALDRLKSSKPVNIEKGLENPYKCLQLSYDNLDIEEAKSLFLFCSVFPEGCEIPSEFLIRFAIGLGLAGEVHSYERARNEMSAAKHKLISSCLLSLLLDDDEIECVRMHDLVRDVAIWIAKNENKGIKCSLEKDEMVEHNSLRYLWCLEFPNELDCSNLEFVCINTDLEVSYGIFKRLGKLRVLFLHWKGHGRRLLSTVSFKLLTNLRCLFLSWWILDDISFIRDMKKLESLTLINCSFPELPEVVVTQVTKLTSIDLSKCDLKGNPFEVIGSHPQLEELYINDGTSKWDLDNENHAELFKKFSVPHALQRYQINLGTTFKGDKIFFSSPRTLYLSCFDTSNAAIVYLAKKAKALGVANIEGGAKNIIPDIFQIETGAINDLVELKICDSEEIEYLIDTSNHSPEVGIVFSELCELRIQRMRLLRALYHGLPPSGLFEKLEQLYLSHCPKLTCLFTTVVARTLVHLEELEISFCNGLKHIVANDDTEEISIEDHGFMFSKLKHLRITWCETLTYLFTHTVARSLVQLEEMEISSCHGLKHIVVDDDTEEITRDDHSSVFSKLKWLKVKWCGNLIYLFTPVVARSLVQLEELEISFCDELKHLVVDDDTKNISTDNYRLVFSKLKRLSVKQCKKLTCLFTLAVAQSLVQLEELEISSCHRLKHVVVDDDIEEISRYDLMPAFSKVKRINVKECKELTCLFTLAIAQSLVQLEELEISVCHGLKHIVVDNDIEEISRDDHMLGLSKLKRLNIKWCEKLTHLFTLAVAQSLVQLEEIEISSCHRLKHIVVYDDTKETSIDDHMLVFSKLKRLTVKECKKLTCLFTLTVARGLVQLEELEISSCHGLKYIVADDKTKEIRDYHSLVFSKLKHLSIKQCENLTCLLTPMVARSLVQLEELEIASCHGLKQIVTDDGTKEIGGDDHILVFSKLKRLTIKWCKKLTCLFTPKDAQSLVQLEELEISFCDGLKHIVADNGIEKISRDDHISVFSKLKRLRITWGYELEYIIPVTYAQSLVQLESLDISYCHNLKYLFSQCIPTHEYQSRNELKIELLSLEQLQLSNMPIMNSIFPQNCYATWPSLRQFVLWDCPEFDIISMTPFMTSWKVEKECDQSIRKAQMTIVRPHLCGSVGGIVAQLQPDIKKMEKQFLTFKYLFIANSKVECIFSLNGLERIRQPMSLGLQELILENLPLMTYICLASKNSFTFQNLKSLQIKGCEKLEVIFSTSVLRFLPELEHLEIRGCKELKQIIEEHAENEKGSLQPCFPKLAALIVYQCHKLKRFMPVSASNDLPNLELLVINGAFELEELIESEGDKIGKLKIELPKLKLLMLMHLSSLCQRIESQHLTHCVVHNCPKLSMPSSIATFKEFLENLSLDKDLEINGLHRRKLFNMLNEMIKSDEISITEEARDELPYLQIKEASQEKIERKVPNLEIPTIKTSKYSKLIERPYPSPFDTALKETHSHDLVDGQSMSEPCLTNQQKSLGEIKSTIETAQFPQERDRMSETTSQLQMNHEDLVTPKERENKGTPHLQLLELEKILPAIPSLNMTESVEEIKTGIIGEVPASVTPALPFGSELRTSSPTYLATPLLKIPSHSVLDIMKHNITGGGCVATHFESSDGNMLVQDSQVLAKGDEINERETRTWTCKKIQNDIDGIQKGSNLMDRQGELGVVSINSSEGPPELGAFKNFVDLDDAQIALLEEAITIYPHLWKVLEKFSVRFQAWMLKTLGDILLFLRNESAVTVTPKREKEFLKLCDEAVQLGFDRSWVDEMRQRVMVKDHRVDHAQTRLSELLKWHDQLTHQLHNIKDEIDNLNDFIGSQKKCFDFL